jgi:apolipoprotein N-acyltransferase
VLAGALAGLTGWRRHAVAVLCGALASAALPPLHLFPLLIPAFTGLLWLLDGTRRPREAAFVGWSFGFGHMATGFYWIGIAFLVDAERHALVMPFAIAGLAAGLAIFPALVTLGLAWVGWRGAARVLLLAILWLLVEWLRSWMLTGFPWNLIGTVWSFSPAMLQLAAITGVWGLSLVTVLAAAAPAMLGDGPGGRGGGRRARWAIAGGLVLLPALVWAGGAARLADAPPVGGEAADGPRLRIVQASIDQALKWKRGLRQKHVGRQMRLTARRGFDAIDLVVWPETAVPFSLAGEPGLRQTLATVVPAGGVLITGAPRLEGEGPTPRLWNSLQALDARGDIVASYDKHHLVPFGEYMPFRWLGGVKKLTAGSMDFSPGSGPVTLRLPELPPFSPLICYEAIFPGRVVAPGARPGWLLNVTNDAWFGTSSGPYQHLASARIRAVEEGLPLVRAANTGISAVIDGYGRTVGRLGLNEIGILDARLPRPVGGITLYARTGDWILLIMTLIAVICTLILRRFLP